MKISLQDEIAFDEFNAWASVDKKNIKKIVSLIKDIRRNPTDGIGKPEPLKYELSGCWSRRITDEHRLIYHIAVYSGPIDPVVRKNRSSSPEN
jgi:toxin YoeB